MVQHKEIIWKGYDNTINLLLKEEGSIKVLSGVTQVAAVFDGTSYDSVTYSSYFDWESGTTGELILKFGQSGVTAGYYPSVEIILYDENNPNGLVWGTIPITIKD